MSLIGSHCLLTLKCCFLCLQSVQQCQLTSLREAFLRTAPVCQTHLPREGSWKISALKDNKVILHGHFTQTI